MISQITNYHTHTVRCHHATGTEREYVEKAIQNGFTVLGFSEHMAWPLTEARLTKGRLAVSELEEYCTTVQQLKKEYADQIHIYLGGECEYFPDCYPWLLEQKERFGMDYLIFGCHYPMKEAAQHEFASSKTPEMLQYYTELALAGMETGYFRCLCHPDLPLKGYPVFDSYARTMCEDICKTAKKLDLTLEYNVRGYQKHGRVKGMGYTSEEFWRIAAECGCTAIVGIDAHALEDLNKECVQEAQQRLTEWGVKVISRFPGLE